MSIPTPNCRHRVDRSHIDIRKSVAVFGFVLLTIACAARADELQAVWRTQSLTVHYRSGSFLYSCGMLTRKVGLVLQAIGATRIRIEQARCAATNVGNGPLQIASMRVSFDSPVPASIVSAAELEGNSARARLLERLGASTAPTGPFNADFRSIDLGADESLDLAASDCELLQVLRRRVITRMAVEVMAQSACSSAPHRLARLHFKARALMPAGPRTTSFAGGPNAEDNVLRWRPKH
jgi:hypothetical protein